ncbi:MAG: DUF2007 domain-containing protein [bacterium]|nr:MAG: DUF2007 domain-containing protein [bacterium]
MPVCPICNSEFEEGVGVCTDCGAELVEPLDTCKDELLCETCGNCVGTDDEYCRHCGAVFEEGITCTEHPDTEAGSVCVICRRPLCGECTETKSGVSFCRQHNDYSFFNNWAVVYTTGTESDAQMIQERLEVHDIPCVVDSRKDSVWGVTFGPLAEIGILVPFEYVLRAEESFRKLNGKG